MKKLLFIFLLFSVSIVMFSGCAINNLADEDELKTMFVEKYPEYFKRHIHQEELFEIDDIEIVRRQTNKEEKKDVVDCDFYVSNERYEGIFKFTLHLNYYDEGGWQLDDCERKWIDGEPADEIKAKVNTVPEEVIKQDLSYWSIYGDFELVDEQFDTETGLLTSVYSANNEFKYLTTSGNLTFKYSLSEDGVEGSKIYWSWKADDIVNELQQQWKLAKRYKAAVTTSQWLDYSDQIPKVYVTANGGWLSALSKGVAYIDIKNISSEKIDMVITVINRNHDGGFSTDQYTQEELSIDTLGNKSAFSREIVRNRDGDYIELRLDKDKGLYTVRYDYEDDRETFCSFVPEQ